MGFTLQVGSNNIRGGLQDGLGGAVVLLQKDNPGLRIILLKAEDISNIGMTPRVDRLVGVTYDADIAVLSSKLPGQGILDYVGVLELIYLQMKISVLIFGQHIRVLLEKVIGAQEQVIEIQGLILV
mgnify:CR=1 FL=1